MSDETVGDATYKPFEPPPAINGKTINGNVILDGLESLGLVGDRVMIPRGLILNLWLSPGALVIEWCRVDGQGHKFRDPDNPTDVATMRVSYRVSWTKEGDA